MSWTTSCPSLRLTFSASTKPFSLPVTPNPPLNYTHSSTPPLLSALLDLKAVSRCSEPAASPMKIRTRKAHHSPLGLSTRRNWWPLHSLTWKILQMRRQMSRPDPRALLPQKHQPRPSPLRNLPRRRLPPSPIIHTWCQNPPLGKTTPNHLLFRGRSGWPDISSSRAYRRG